MSYNALPAASCDVLPAGLVMAPMLGTTHLPLLIPDLPVAPVSLSGQVLTPRPALYGPCRSPHSAGARLQERPPQPVTLRFATAHLIRRMTSWRALSFLARSLMTADDDPVDKEEAARRGWTRTRTRTRTETTTAARTRSWGEFSWNWTRRRCGQSETRGSKRAGSRPAGTRRQP